MSKGFNTLGAVFVILIVGTCGRNSDKSSSVRKTSFDYSQNSSNESNYSRTYSKSTYSERAIYNRYVTAGTLNVRSGPSGAKVATLRAGNYVKVYETNAGWSRISQKSETPRWVSSQYLSVTRPTRTSFQPSYSNQNKSRTAYYQNCSAARAAGAAPIYRGEPGYRSRLDRDNDGIACE